MEQAWCQAPQTQGEPPASHVPTCSWLELALCCSHTASPTPYPHLQHLFPITASSQSIRENTPPHSPCYQMPLFFQGADARHLLVSMHLPRAAWSLEPTASQRDRERESEQWCCGWALPLCPRALGTAPACCPQCHQGDGAAVCTKLAKVRAAVRGAGCVNAIF